MVDSGEQLVAQAVDGDTEALSELLRQHGPSVERTLQIGQIWQGVIESSDVMQVTYLEAFVRITTFDPERSRSFEAWLRRIAENNLRDAIRGLERQKQPQPRKRVKPMTHEDSLVGLYDLLGETSATPSRNVGRKEICSQLGTAIDALPERYAQVIKLYDLEGQEIADVAEALGKSTGAVHMLRARAHDRLREQMGSGSFFLGSA